MRSFRHLTSKEIREIHVGFLAGEPKLVIARRLQIDNSTVHYHINKVKDLPRSHLVSLVAPKCSKGHTAFKCLVCGKSFDNIKSEEFQEIKRLRDRVRYLESQLTPRDEETRPLLPNPVVCVSC
jgi:hypothetical protein